MKYDAIFQKDEDLYYYRMICKKKITIFKEWITALRNVSDIQVLFKKVFFLNYKLIFLL